MKLTNISLAVLVALGLVACGGSDDNKNQTTDNQNAGHQTGGNGGAGGNGGNGGAGGTPPKTDDNNIDPNRKAADFTVPAAIVDAVNADKKVLISNQFGDKALGYDSASKYDENKSTKPGDVRFTTTYNFSKEGDVFANNSALGPKRVGAIFPSEDPNDGKEQNAFVKGKSGKYYRVRSEDVLLDYNDKSTYKLVDVFTGADLTKAGQDIGYTSGAGIPQSKVVFLANADIKSTTNVADFIVDPSLAPDPSSNMNAGLSQVILTNVSLLGDSYNPNDINQSLDLNKIPKGKITTTPVTGDITIVNTKRDALSNDRILTRQIEVGNLKAYNLGYSIAYVGLDSSKENSKNIFNLDSQKITTGDVNNNLTKNDFIANNDGTYQVSGYQTPALPKDGRAIYTGKSFSESTEGDVQLVAEFFADRASVKGIINNRKDILDDDKALPTLVLQPVQLTNPTTHTTGGSGKVTGDSAHYTDWSVQFYGLEAEEAGGYVYGKDIEVYTTKRDRLSNQSNDSSVK